MPTDGSGRREGVGSPSPFAAERLPGPGEIVAGKYEVERVLGAGGMGVVLAARHLQLGQRVAIKFMLASAAQDRTAVERFLREARAAVALSSEHVARVIDVGTLESGAPYMVMEYLAGRDLGQILQAHGPMAISTAVDLVLQACDAIAEAHALGIVHRDLKPSNLFVASRRDGAPLVKVLDFGISKAAASLTTEKSQALTASGAVMGSPFYMSPEQVRSAKAADARSDIWSLGVVLYQLLTGKTPFEGETLGETLARILADDPMPIRTQRPDVPPELEAAVFRCMERDVDRRVQNVARLARMLSPFASAEGGLVVERIARSSSGPADAEPASATSAASAVSSTPAGRLTAPAGLGDFSALPEETGPAWLKSNAASPRPRSPLSRYVPLVVTALAGAAAGAGALAVLRARSQAAAAQAREPSSEPVGPAPAGPPPAVAHSGEAEAPPSPTEVSLAEPQEAPAPSSSALRISIPAAPSLPSASWRAGGPMKPARLAPPLVRPTVRTTKPSPAAPSKSGDAPAGSIPDFGY